MKVALIVLDATRRDFLGPYGGPEEATPTINRLADRGIVFEDCVAGAPWTPASHATMFTGQYPSHHGVRGNDLTYPTTGHYLPEVVSESGIRTQGIGAEPWLSRRQGVHRGFDRFHDRSKVRENLEAPGAHDPTDLPDLLAAGAGYAAEKVRTRLGTDREADRFDIFLFRQWARRADSFTFLNIPVAHGPYHPPQEFRDQVGVRVESSHPFVDDQSIHPYIVGEIDPPSEAWEDVRSLYTAGVAHADYLLGRAIDSLDRDTWILLTADHGDNLGENGRAGHQFSLHDSLINVPLILAHSSLSPGRRSDIVSHVDIAPTLYDILGREGIDVPIDGESLPGRSLLTDPAEDRVVFSEYGPPGPHTNALLNHTEDVDQATLDDLLRAQQAALTSEYKYLRYDDGECHLYRRGDETTDVTGTHPELVDRLSAAIDDALGRPTDVGLEDIDGYVEADVEKRLERLGYL